jgi:3-isopropylmalate/(R)-2-methylmalate dehydratase small subunit
MQVLLSGKAFVFGKNIDTDRIYPSRFVEFTDVDEIKKYAMYGIDPEFAKKFDKGDIIVAGTNFGCGSSREHAAIALKEIGAGAVIAESFGRIFFRNAIIWACLSLSAKMFPKLLRRATEWRLIWRKACCKT